MAKLNGILGNISIYKDWHGNTIMRSKPDISKKLKKHPSYIRTRENGAAFGKSATTGKLIRSAFAPWIDDIGDNQLSGRLVKELMPVIKAVKHEDKMNPEVFNGDFSILEGFDFNSHAKLNNTLLLPYSIELEKNNSRMVVTIPSFIPDSHTLKCIGNYTHFRIDPIVATFDFAANRYTLFRHPSKSPVPLNSRKRPATKCSTNIILKPKQVFIVAMSVEFYRGKTLPKLEQVAGGGYNAFTIIKTGKSE